MDRKLQDLPLRSGVGIVLLNNNNKIFVAKRIDNPKNFWQMPQGGVDKNENFLNAAYRELKEETSIENVKLIKELDGFMTYELPSNLIGIIWKGRYRGQKQKWFIVWFLGPENEKNLETKKPEFIDWKWLDIDNLPHVIVDFKKDVYKKLVIELDKFIA